MKIELGKAEIEEAVAMYLRTKFVDGDKFLIGVEQIVNYGRDSSTTWKITAEAAQTEPDGTVADHQS